MAANSVLNRVFRWNSLLCPPLGFLFNIGLLWLILHRTPKEMRAQSRILLQTCLVDILLLGVLTIGQNAIFIQPGLIVTLFDGFLADPFTRLFGPLGVFYLHMLWFYLQNLDVLGISVQFVARYLVLNRGVKITLHRYLLLLLIPIAIIFLLTIYLFAIRIDTLDVRPPEWNLFNQTTFDTETIFFTVKFEQNISTTLWLYLVNSVQFISYAVIFFCGWRMVRHVNAYAGFNGQLKTMNKQLTRNLILIASFPMLTTIINFMFTHIGLMSIEVQLLLSMMTNWVAVLNPLASVATFRPYREALVNLFLCKSAITVQQEQQQITIVKVK